MRRETLDTGDPPVLTLDEADWLLRACEGRGFTDRRDKAIIQLFLDGGLRLGEMVNIKMRDLDMTTKDVRVQGKTRPRLATFGPTTTMAIHAYLLVRKREPYAGLDNLWIGQRGALTEAGISQMIERRAFVANVTVHPHLLRHTFASILLTGSEDHPPALEADVKALGGWVTTEMMGRYGRAVATQRAIKNYHRGRSPVDRIVERRD